MTTLRRPNAIKPGATLAIVSPASTPRPELVEAGCKALEHLGYRTRVYPHALDRGPLYYAGTLEERLADLHAAFADPTIDAILCTRGGWGSAELLPHLDKALIAANPKPFLGYSDQTSLHLWLQREANLVSFQAPMVAADFSRPDGPDLTSWHSALVATEPWSLGPASGLRTLRPGSARGILGGGCLSIFAEALGTPYGPQPTGGILFFEDIGVKPYQWDRMLVHLRHAGILASAQGIVFGDMQSCGTPQDKADIEASILHALRDFSGPIGIGITSGHVSQNNITLPFGIEVRLDLEQAGNPRLHFLESSVEA